MTSPLADVERFLAHAERSAHANDPIAFARSLRAEGRNYDGEAALVPLVPDPWQQRALTSAKKRIVLNCHRQSGKSTVTAIIALQRAIYVPRSLVLIVSASSRQSKLLLRKVREFLAQLPAKPAVDEESTQTIEFSNGSRIVSLPSSEETIRGFSAVSILIVDEAGDVDDSVYKAVRPMVARSGGSIIVLGTPRGRRGFFFRLWEDPDPKARWEKIEAKASDTGRIDADTLEEERVALGASYVAEYEGAFVNSAEGLVYGGYDATRNVVPTLPDGEPKRPWSYVLGVDFGIVRDTALTVLAYRANDPCVYVVESFKKPMAPHEVAETVLPLQRRYDFERIVGDEDGQGRSTAENMRQRFAIPIIAAEKKQKQGAIMLANGDLRRGRIQLVRPTCGPLLEEMTTLAWVTTAEGVTKEAPGMANHCCDSFLYAWRACTAYHEEPLPPPLTPQERLLEEERRLEAALDASIEEEEREARFYGS